MSEERVERVERVEAEQLRPDLWVLIVIGDRGSRRKSNLYNTKEDALREGQHRIGLVMR